MQQVFGFPFSGSRLAEKNSLPSKRETLLQSPTRFIAINPSRRQGNTRMQAYDLIMLIVLGISTILGAIKGFAWQVASLASIVVSYFVACRFRFQVAEMIHAAPPWNQFLAMLILYVGSSFVIWVGFRLFSGMIDQIRLKEFDRHLGAAFGLTKGLLYCLIITMFAMSLLGPEQQTAVCQSRSGYYITSALDKSVGLLPNELHDVVGPYLARLDAQLKDGRNGISNNDSLLNGLPSLPGFGGGQTGQFGQVPSGQGNENWNLGGLIPNGLAPGNNQPNSGNFGNGVFGTGGPSTAPSSGGILPPNQDPYQPQQPSYGNIPIFPQSEFSAPNGNGFSNEGAPQSAQQPGMIFPR
jgi:membrane protein required for colicin V production